MRSLLPERAGWWAVGYVAALAGSFWLLHRDGSDADMFAWLIALFVLSPPILIVALRRWWLGPLPVTAFPIGLVFVVAAADRATSDDFLGHGLLVLMYALAIGAWGTALGALAIIAFLATRRLAGRPRGLAS